MPPALGEFGERQIRRKGTGAVCVVNLSSEPIAMPEGEVLVRSDGDDSEMLPPDAAAWVR